MVYETRVTVTVKSEYNLGGDIKVHADIRRYFLQAIHMQKKLFILMFGETINLSSVDLGGWFKKKM